MGRLLLLFTVTPLVELWLLLQLGKRVGAGPTIALVLLTGSLGAWLARHEGTRAMRDFIRATQAGEWPGQALFDGMAVFIGGALLLTPGIVTDVLGAALLIPPSRHLLQAWVSRAVRERIAQGRIVVINGGATGNPRPQQQTTARPEHRVYDATFNDGAGNKTPEDNTGR